jgi:hypothetical protein
MSPREFTLRRMAVYNCRTSGRVGYPKPTMQKNYKVRADDTSFAYIVDGSKQSKAAF